MRRKAYRLVAVVALFLTAAPALPHHSLVAEYGTSKRGKFRGVLTRFALINPHVRWFFDVKQPNGKLIKWEITGAGPQQLRACEERGTSNI